MTTRREHTSLTHLELGQGLWFHGCETTVLTTMPPVVEIRLTFLFFSRSSPVIHHFILSLLQSFAMFNFKMKNVKGRK